MFIGHGMLAFAIVAVVAALVGWSPQRALLIGVVAGAFATLPDIDMVYAPVGFVLSFDGFGTADEAFWSSASVAHRGVTHALPIAIVAAVGFAAVAYRGLAHPSTVAAAGGVAVLIMFVSTASGAIAGVILALFALGGGAITAVALRLEFTAVPIGLAAAVGLISHPFGDLFTGSPPALWYPFDGPPLETVILHGDPTLHLLGAFFIELATIWAAVLVVAWLTDLPLLSAIRPRAGIGVGYAGMVFVIPAPTLEVPTPFVLTVLAVGLLAIPLRLDGRDPIYWRVVVTALTAVTVAALAFTAAYLVLVGT